MLSFQKDMNNRYNKLISEDDFVTGYADFLKSKDIKFFRNANNQTIVREYILFTLRLKTDGDTLKRIYEITEKTYNNIVGHKLSKS